MCCKGTCVPLHPNPQISPVTLHKNLVECDEIETLLCFPACAPLDPQTPAPGTYLSHSTIRCPTGRSPTPCSRLKPSWPSTLACHTPQDALLVSPFTLRPHTLQDSCPVCHSPTPRSPLTLRCYLSHSTRCSAGQPLHPETSHSTR